MAVSLAPKRALSRLAIAVVALISVAWAGPAGADHILTHAAASAVTPEFQRGAEVGRALFHKGAEIKIKKDARVYITPHNIPQNDRLLGAYAADSVNSRGAPHGSVNGTTNGTTAPGLLGIAKQAFRTQSSPWAGERAYSLADAMRDAIWRKRTAARLKTLMEARRPTCPERADSGLTLTYAQTC